MSSNGHYKKSYTKLDFSKNNLNQTQRGFNTNTAITCPQGIGAFGVDGRNFNSVAQKLDIISQPMLLPDVKTLQTSKNQTTKGGNNTVLGVYSNEKKTMHLRKNTALLAGINEVMNNNLMSPKESQQSPAKHLKSPLQSPNRLDMSVMTPRDDSRMGAQIPGLSAAKTSHEPKRRYQSLPRSQYRLSVQETVQAGSKKTVNSGFGIPNYPDVKKGTNGMFWHHDVNFPIVFGIHKDKYSKVPRHYLDGLMKTKKIVPPPNTYNIPRDLLIKQNMMTSKSPRVTEAIEIEKLAKKNKFPDAATYIPIFK